MYSKTIWQKRFAKALTCGCLLADDEFAVMIDCGYGAGNIRAYAQTLTDKPVKYVINTHYHFDHTANDAYFDQLYTGTGEKSGEVFDHYYAAAMYGISPDFKATPVTESAGRRKNEQQTTADGKTLYQRGRVRPGDETKNAPETIPTGQRMTYTVDGFPVTYIETSK